jgi:hypothetical protein
LLLDYPLEQGAFESYDKVQTPFVAWLRFVTGGSIADKQAFLASIEAITASLEFVDVVTPERVYQSANVSHYDYRRTAVNGVGLLAVDVWVTEVRVTATQAFTNTSQPSGSDTVHGGTIQASPAPSSVSGLAPGFE